jgi:dTDP-L-rhamnose 4-epimerase
VRVLVTGAAGFIGRRVATSLRETGDEIVGLDQMIEAAHPADSEAPDGVERADVRDGAALERLLDGIDVVCHQAAMVGNGVDAQDLPGYASHNDLGTAVLLAAMARAGVTRLVLASSMVVYGEGRYTCPDHGEVAPRPRRSEDLDAGVFDPRCPRCDALLRWGLVTEDAPIRPRSSYAVSKVAQEQYADAWATLEAGRGVALRYHNVYGPDMPADTPYAGVAAIFRSALARGEGPPVFEDGQQMRDFVHVDDVAAANVAAVHRVGDHPVGITPYNVCSGRPTDIATMAALIAQQHGGPDPVVTGRYRAADVRHVVASPAAAVDGLGFTASVDPRDGLREFAHARLRPTR